MLILLIPEKQKAKEMDRELQREREKWCCIERILDNGKKDNGVDKTINLEDRDYGASLRKIFK